MSYSKDVYPFLRLFLRNKTFIKEQNPDYSFLLIHMIKSILQKNLQNLTSFSKAVTIRLGFLIKIKLVLLKPVYLSLFTLKLTFFFTNQVLLTDLQSVFLAFTICIYCFAIYFLISSNGHFESATELRSFVCANLNSFGHQLFS